MPRKLLFVVLAFCSGCGLVAQAQPVPFETAPATGLPPRFSMGTVTPFFGTLTDGTPIFEYAAAPMLPGLPVRVAGHDAHVDMDTGSGFGLTLPTKLLGELPLATQPKQVRTSHTIYGDTHESAARVDGAIEIGKYKLDVEEVWFGDVSNSPATGNLGW